jgi:hypothetical protein
MENWSETAQLIWQKIFDWNVSASAQQMLIDILPGRNDCLTQLFENNNMSAAAINQQLRLILGPILHKQPARKGIAGWIVESWGGIHRGGENVPFEWHEQFAGFDHEAILNFINAHKFTRISSWSKLLSFANCKKYAIYDSRTTTCLNIALRQVGCSQQFFMPPSRNTHVYRAQQLLRDLETDGPLLGYLDHNELLQCIASQNELSLLEVEMTVFANAPFLAWNFRADYD